MYEAKQNFEKGACVREEEGGKDRSNEGIDIFWKLQLYNI